MGVKTFEAANRFFWALKPNKFNGLSFSLAALLNPPVTWPKPVFNLVDKFVENRARPRGQAGRNAPDGL